MCNVATQISNFVDFAGMENLSAEERELLPELVDGVHAIRHRSISLTIHDGRLVEIHKTERMRRKA